MSRVCVFGLAVNPRSTSRRGESLIDLWQTTTRT
jgi:hypothetical protein